VSVGDYLPGSAAGDAYCMVRVGLQPDSQSKPLAVQVIPPGDFTGILVVEDSDATSSYDFTGSDIAGVIGISTGTLICNPALVVAYAGQFVWYAPRTFRATDTGIVGYLDGADDDPLFIAPIPQLEQYPFIRIGSRRHLTAIVVSTDAALAAIAAVGITEVGVSLATGKLRFNAEVVGRADKNSPYFDPEYLGARVVYDGLACNASPQPLWYPVSLVSAAGAPIDVTATNDLYVPVRDSRGYNGIAISGILHEPDGTGAIPNNSSVPGVRPGGEVLTDQTTGLVRKVGPTRDSGENFGDLIVFGSTRADDTIYVADREDALPALPFLVLGGRAYVAREAGVADRSKAAISRKDRAEFLGQRMYFQQALLTPSTVTSKARVISRVRDSFPVGGTENLYFAVNGIFYVWSAFALFPGGGSKSTAEIADSFNTLMAGGDAIAYDSNGYLVIESTLVGGDIEIGFGINAAKDLSGCTLFGILPGWRGLDGEAWWHPDSGISLGLFRNPLNTDRTKPEADFKTRYQVSNEVLSEYVPSQPVVVFRQPPLQDVPGYDESTFFQLTTTIKKGTQEATFTRYLKNLVDVAYRFEENHFQWLNVHSGSEILPRAAQTLQLGHTGITPETMIGVAPNAGRNLWVSETGGPFVTFEQGVDYLLPQNGLPGTVLFTESVGRFIGSGFQGSWTAGGDTLTNAFATGEATFTDLGAMAGYKIKIPSGDSKGSYTVTSAPSASVLQVAPNFPSGNGTTPGSWELYHGLTETVYDPGLIADVIADEFNHLQTEPFKVRVLSPMGDVPIDKTAQAASRLVAPIADAIKSSRIMGVRFGLAHGATWADSLALIQSLTAQVYILSETSLGVMQNGTLVVPGSALTDSEHTRFAGGYFSIRVGTTLYVNGVDLIGVSTFSADPGANIEYLLLTGELKFGSAVISEFEGSYVSWVPTYMDPDVLSAGIVEVGPNTGSTNFSTADMTQHAGTEAYFVEQMVTEGRLDVALNPLTGTIGFNKPLEINRLVEIDYLVAATDGTLSVDRAGQSTHIVEFLPLYIRSETCTLVSANLYAFNSAGKTIFTDVVPTVYVGATMMNFGQEDTIIDIGTNQIRFLVPIDTSRPVTISYAVLETFGGEKVFSASHKPIYRPPFYLPALTANFTLFGDRTGDVTIGKLLRVGPFPTYIKSVAYAATTDTTTVGIYPSPTTEVGSRSPGNDVLITLTGIPVTTTVDTVTVPTAPAGFLLPVVQTWDPVDRDQMEITVHGNVLQFAVPGHLMELGKYPFIVASARLTDDGLNTIVVTTSPFPKHFDAELGEVLKLSVRPIYPPSSRSLLGVGPVLETEPVEVILWGETDENGSLLPGRTLAAGMEYDLEKASGAVTLIAPIQEPLGATQKLSIRFTKVKTLSPYMDQGVLHLPRVKYSYRYNDQPSEDNGFLGGQLKASYTVYSPDSFYSRVTPLLTYMGEASQDILRGKAAEFKAPGGPITPAMPTAENYTHGVSGIDTLRTNLTDTDRAARSLLDFYAQVTGAFEQIKEAITGDVVGDRDGKFRFFIGRGQEYTSPGFEDPFTGNLNPRNIYSEVFAALATVSPDWTVPILEDDWVVNPDGASLTGGVVSGSFPSGYLVGRMIAQQRGAITNDIDDQVLVGLKNTEVRFNPFPIYQVRAKGDFLALHDPSTLSRIFPEKTKGYLTTYPGLDNDVSSGDKGVYSYLRLIDGDFESTWGTTIGRLANPVMGELSGVSEVTLRKRFPRARVWKYYPTGIPQGAFDGTLPNVPLDRPCVVATPLPLRDFPIDPTTGYPDVSKLQQQTAPTEGLADLTTGEIEVSSPPFYHPIMGMFASKMQVAFGHPDSTISSVGCPLVLLDGISPSGVFVDEVLYGCVVTFKTVDALGADLPIVNPTHILQMQDQTSGAPLTLDPGDTLLITPPGFDAQEPTTPPTPEDQARFRDALPAFRVGSDVLVRKSGKLVDISLPGGSDPIPWFLDFQNLMNQTPPKPMVAYEAEVEITNSSTSPLMIPALLGQAKDDTGDVSTPYIGATNTELERLGYAQDYLAEILATVSAGSDPVTVPWPGPGNPNWNFVYPDEIKANDGTIRTTLAGDISPAALLTTVWHNPVSGDPLLLGTENAQAYDLLLTQYGTGTAELPEGSQGWLSIGRVNRNGLNTYSMIEPPRFITPTAMGDDIRYTVDHFMSFCHDETSWDWTLGMPPLPVNPTGVQITVDSNPGVESLTLDFSTVLPQIALNDGTAGATGGLNTVLFAHVLNLLTLRMFVREPLGVFYPGEYTVPITFDGAGQVTADLAVAGLAVVFNQTSIVVTGVGASTVLNLALHPELPSSVIALNVVQTDYCVDFTFSLSTVAGKSTTGAIFTDRLTFLEQIDFRLARERGWVHPIGKQRIDCQLLVPQVETETSATSTINRGINGDNGGGIFFPLTFLERDSSDLKATDGISRGVGTFEVASAIGAGDEVGSLRAMGFEGYRELPLGAGAIATGNVLGGVVTSVVVAAPGAGYQGGFVEVAFGGVGTGAAGYATVDPVTGAVLTVTVTNPGHGYGAGPLVIPVTLTHNAGNVAITSQDITFSMLPSMGLDETVTLPGDGGIICRGFGLVQDPVDNIITNIDVTAGAPDGGAVSKVVPGDTVVISGGHTVQGSIKTGTYLVRHAVEQNTPLGVGGILSLAGDEVRALTLSSQAGGGSGWVDIRFPKIAESSSNPSILTSSISTGGFSTITTATAHGLIVGDHVHVAGHSVVALNRTFAVAAPVTARAFRIATALGTGGTGGVAHVGPSIDSIDRTIRITDIFDSATMADSPSGHGFPAAGILYIVLVNDGADSQVLAAEYVSVEDNPLNADYRKFTLRVNTGTEYRAADGSNIAMGNEGAEFWALLEQGQLISGMAYFAIQPFDEQGLPANNTVGFTTDTAGLTRAIYGLAGITITSPGATVGPQEFVEDQTYCNPVPANMRNIVAGVAADDIRVHPRTLVAGISTVFQADKFTTVYAGVPGYLDISNFTTTYRVGPGTAWDNIRNPIPPGVNTAATCILPQDVLTTEAPFSAIAGTNVYDDVLTNGFWAKSGIFLEPSFARPAQNLAADAVGDQRLVQDNTPAVAVTEIGFRFDGVNETIDLEVRRIRRFHEVQDSLAENLNPLRFAYEVRRGRITNYASDVALKQAGLVTATGYAFPPDSPYYLGGAIYMGTQLGLFTSPDVAIREGDIFRLIKSNLTAGAYPRPWEVVEEVPIMKVAADDVVRLMPPGLTNPEFLNDVTLGQYERWYFEIYLKNAPVPHEQSCEQLLTLATERVVTSTAADYTTQEGGYVPNITLALPYSGVVNKLQDDSTADSFSKRGVLVGDIVLVDPAGRVRGPTGETTPPESGSRPYGDKGVLPRQAQDPAFFASGHPSALDDNRGFYRVTAIDDTNHWLEVDGTSRFGGILGTDVIFPPDVVAQTTLGYAVYPTVNGSPLPPTGIEGQVDLRPTRLAGLLDDGTPAPIANSFSYSFHSIRPFSYKVIRPSGLFSEEAIDIILSTRERTLSLIEQFRGPMSGGKSGDYYIFQQDNHGDNIGLVTIADSGLGVFNNSLIIDAGGQTNTLPFGNDYDCLSILDRRFWALDTRLDYLTSDGTGVGVRMVTGPGDVPYTAYNDVTAVPAPSLVRPVLPDWVDIALDIDDRFRQLRNAWIGYRTDRKTGTLAAIERLDSQIPELKEEMVQTVLQRKGLIE